MLCVLWRRAMKRDMLEHTPGHELLPPVNDPRQRHLLEDLVYEGLRTALPP